MTLKAFRFWFLTGSQHLYGKQTLEQVDKDSKAMVDALAKVLPASIVWKPVLTTPDAITTIIREANADPDCAGIITWMHTFSPSKMWIAGLSALNKPMLHFHTQFNRDIPWSGIDMDFMNLNQSAHGDREHGYIAARLRLNRCVVTGHWQEKRVQNEIDTWIRAACGVAEGKNLKVVRFGDNMREVAVTEGDKVDAQIRFGWSVNGFGLGGIAQGVADTTDVEADKLVKVYTDTYQFAGKLEGKALASVREQAKIEIAMRAILEKNGAMAFTTTFQDLHGLKQLPGLAVQRLMNDGYGFGAEGDWKTAAMVRVSKVMALGLQGGTSFMEDYTYHLDPADEMVLGAHMLEVCPSIAAGKPKLEVHALGIGDKEDPARLVFDASTGPALNSSLVDMGDRFRLILNTVKAVKPIADMPKLPVARVLWKPEPNLADAATAWIYAGGAHHTTYSTSLGLAHMEQWARMSGVETLVIDKDLRMRDFLNEIRWNDTGFKNRY